MGNAPEPKYVILDTDMGSDDAWALQMLVKAEKYHKNVKLLAITTVNGNTTVENAIKNAYRILDGLDRTDVPIHRGATEALIPRDEKVELIFGSNGFFDVDVWLPHYPDINAVVQPKHAVEIIRDLVRAHPKQISIICLGPLTNIALAIKMYPEVKDAIKDVFIMGGNVKGVGNTTSCAEFNFYMDPEAVHIVLDSLSCPKTILPWECCLDESCYISAEWRCKAYENIPCKNMQILNELDKIACQKSLNILVCDAYLTGVFLFPKCIKQQEPHHATVELHGHVTRGQMILDHTKKKDDNVTIIQTLHEDKFKEILMWTATAGINLEYVDNLLHHF